MECFGVIVGVGNGHRGDDGLGFELVRRMELLRIQNPEWITGWDLFSDGGDLFDLVSLLRSYRRAIILDAFLGPESDRHPSPGTLLKWRVDKEPIPVDPFCSSTHAVSLSCVLELIKILGDLPPYCLVVGIEVSTHFSREGLTPKVFAAVDQLLHELPEILSSAIAESSGLPVSP
jgi:hydrogenase maturation protease